MKTFSKLLLVVVVVCLAAYAQGAENAQGFLRFGPRVFPPSRLPSPTELFGQFAAVMVNGTCNVDWDLLPNDDPDEHRSTCELLRARGLECQVHHVTTSGGYIIELHRIVSKSNGNSGGNTIKNHPVILQPGLMGTSSDFLMAEADFSADAGAPMGANMGLELFKRGYDVWLSNNRGNEYGLRHTSLTKEDPSFWAWTFEQIGTEDIPSVVSYVKANTSASKVHYVGHSQGTAVMFVQLSKNPGFASNLASFTAISPITRIGDAKTAYREFVGFFDPLFELEDGSVFEPNPFVDGGVSFACSSFGLREACKLIYFSITGPNCEELDIKRLPVYTGHMPSSTSRRNLRHFNQLFQTNRFAPFSPPTLIPLPGTDYNLSAIKAPQTLVIYGRNDWFVPQTGVDRLKGDLPDRSVFNFTALSKPLANHIDPLIGITLAPETNSLVFGFLERNDAN